MLLCGQIFACAGVFSPSAILKRFSNTGIARMKVRRVGERGRNASLGGVGTRLFDVQRATFHDTPRSDFEVQSTENLEQHGGYQRHPRSQQKNVRKTKKKRRQCYVS